MTPCHTCRLRYASLALQWHPRRELAARQAERGTCARPTLIWVMQNTQESNAAAGRAAVFMRSPADSQKSVQPTVPTTCSRHGESANGWFVKLRIAPPVNEQLRATYSNLQQLRASYSSSPGAGGTPLGHITASSAVAGVPDAHPVRPRHAGYARLRPGGGGDPVRKAILVALDIIALTAYAYTTWGEARGGDSPP